VLLENTQDQPSFFQPDLGPILPRQNRCVVAGVDVSESLAVDIKQALEHRRELALLEHGLLVGFGRRVVVERQLQLRAVGMLW
jgi:hypothetical protein